MRTILCAAVAFLCLGSFTVAATKHEKPDQEMLKIMEILQQWDMIKDLELMRDLRRVEAEAERHSTSPTKDAAGRKKDPTK